MVTSSLAVDHQDLLVGDAQFGGFGGGLPSGDVQCISALFSRRARDTKILCIKCFRDNGGGGEYINDLNFGRGTYISPPDRRSILNRFRPRLRLSATQFVFIRPSAGGGQRRETFGGWMDTPSMQLYLNGAGPRHRRLGTLDAVPDAGGSTFQELYRPQVSAVKPSPRGRSGHRSLDVRETSTGTSLGAWSLFCSPYPRRRRRA